MKKYGNPLVKPHHSEHKYGNITDLTWDRLDMGSTVNVDDMPGDVVKFDLLGNKLRRILTDPLLPLLRPCPLLGQARGESLVVRRHPALRGETGEALECLVA